jgi:hypothetical protein
MPAEHRFYGLVEVADADGPMSERLWAALVCVSDAAKSRWGGTPYPETNEGFAVPIEAFAGIRCRVRVLSADAPDRGSALLGRYTPPQYHRGLLVGHASVELSGIGQTPFPCSVATGASPAWGPGTSVAATTAEPRPAAFPSAPAASPYPVAE